MLALLFTVVKKRAGYLYSFTLHPYIWGHKYSITCMTNVNSKMLVRFVDIWNVREGEEKYMSCE